MPITRFTRSGTGEPPHLPASAGGVVNTMTSPDCTDFVIFSTTIRSPGFKVGYIDVDGTKNVCRKNARTTTARTTATTMTTPHSTSHRFDRFFGVADRSSPAVAPAGGGSAGGLSGGSVCGEGSPAVCSVGPGPMGG